MFPIAASQINSNSDQLCKYHHSFQQVIKTHWWLKHSSIIFTRNYRIEMLILTYEPGCSSAYLQSRHWGGRGGRIRSSRALHSAFQVSMRAGLHGEAMSQMINVSRIQQVLLQFSHKRMLTLILLFSFERYYRRKSLDPSSLLSYFPLTGIMCCALLIVDLFWVFLFFNYQTAIKFHLLCYAQVYFH